MANVQCKCDPNMHDSIIEWVGVGVELAYWLYQCCHTYIQVKVSSSNHTDVNTINRETQSSLTSH